MDATDAAFDEADHAVELDLVNDRLIANAVVDALVPLGVEHVDVPLTAERVWRAAEGKRASGGSANDG